MPSPSSSRSTATEVTPARSKWGTRLTSEMREKLAVARGELGTDSVAKLMTATGASRLNVRTWLRSQSAPIKLGRPTFFSSSEEDVLAMYMAAWTKGGDLLTCELAAVLLRQISRTWGGRRTPNVGLVWVGSLGGRLSTYFWGATRSSIV